MLLPSVQFALSITNGMYDCPTFNFRTTEVKRLLERGDRGVYAHFLHDATVVSPTLMGRGSSGMSPTRSGVHVDAGGGHPAIDRGGTVRSAFMVDDATRHKKASNGFDRVSNAKPATPP